MFVQLLSCLAAQAFSAPTLGCALTNRLCVTTNLQNDTLATIYYPATIFPTDVRSDSLILSLFYGSLANVQQPCDISAQLVQQWPLKADSVGSGINSTSAQLSIPATLAPSTANTFFFQLADPNKRQCILGPSLNGEYVDSVSISFLKKTSTAVTSTTAAETSSNTGSQIPSTFPMTGSNDSNSSSFNGSSRLAVILISLVGLALFIICCIVFVMIMRRKQKRRDAARNSYSSDIAPQIVIPDSSSFGSKIKRSLSRTLADKPGKFSFDGSEDILTVSEPEEMPTRPIPTFNHQ